MSSHVQHHFPLVVRSAQIFQALPRSRRPNPLAAQRLSALIGHTTNHDCAQSRPEAVTLDEWRYHWGAMKRPGLWFFCVAWAAFAFTWLWRAVAGPNTGRAADLAATAVMALFFTALFVGLAAWTPHMPSEWLTTPHPEYWHSPEHRREFNALVADMFYGLAAATVLIPVLVNVGAVFGYPDWCGLAIVSTLLVGSFAVIIRSSRQLDRIPRTTQMGPDGGAGRTG